MVILQIDNCTALPDDCNGCQETFHHDPEKFHTFDLVNRLPITALTCPWPARDTRAPNLRAVSDLSVGLYEWGGAALRAADPWEVNR